MTSISVNADWESIRSEGIMSLDIQEQLRAKGKTNRAKSQDGYRFKRSGLRNDWNPWNNWNDWNFNLMQIPAAAAFRFG
jgi:hypothetical protein